MTYHGLPRSTAQGATRIKSHASHPVEMRVWVINSVHGERIHDHAEVSNDVISTMRYVAPLHSRLYIVRSGLFPPCYGRTCARSLSQGVLSA